MNIRSKKKRSEYARKIYAALALRGTNLMTWSAEHGYTQSMVWKTIHNGHDGIVSRQIIRSLAEDLGVVNTKPQQKKERS